jgi:hypothetical protein
MLRLALGALAIGSEEVARRLKEFSSLPPPVHRADGYREPASSARRRRETAAQRLGYLAAGLAAESVTTAWLSVRFLTRASGRAVDAVEAAAGLPVVRRGTGPGRAAIARFGATLEKLVERGRQEQLEGRGLAMLLLTETASHSVRDIADSAIKEVSHSPEIAALVRAQSTSLAANTILEVRANSEQADDRLERRVRSWLRLDRASDGRRRDAIPSPAGQQPG